MKKDKRKLDAKVPTLPVVVFIFKGDRGLVYWQSNWPSDTWEIPKDMNEASLWARYAAMAGAIIEYKDPNDEYGDTEKATKDALIEAGYLVNRKIVYGKEIK